MRNAPRIHLIGSSLSPSRPTKGHTTRTPLRREAECARRSIRRETLAGHAAGTVEYRRMSLFGGHAKHPNLTRIAESLGAHLGLTLTQPADDVVAVLDQMT